MSKAYTNPLWFIVVYRAVSVKSGQMLSSLYGETRKPVAATPAAYASSAAGSA